MKQLKLESLDHELKLGYYTSDNVHLLKIKDRIDPLNAETVTELKESILKNSLINPISVIIDYGKEPSATLVAGLHRAEAIKALWEEGYKHIKLFYREVTVSQERAKLVELTENIARKTYTKAEKAERIAMMLELLQITGSEKGQKIKEATNPKGPMAPFKPMPLKELSEKLGIPERSLKRDLKEFKEKYNISETYRSMSEEDFNKFQEFYRDKAKALREAEEEKARIAKAIKDKEQEKLREEYLKKWEVLKENFIAEATKLNEVIDKEMMDDIREILNVFSTTVEIENISN